MIEIKAKEKKHIAIVGFQEYKKSIRGVDDWLLNEDEDFSDYDFMLKRNDKGILLYTPNWNEGKGILTQYEKSDEVHLIQALVDVVSKEQLIGIDWYDILHELPGEVRYFSFITKKKSWKCDVEEWIGNLKEISNNNIMLMLQANLSLMDISEIADKISESFIKDIIVTVVCNEEFGEDIIVSIWA